MAQARLQTADALFVEPGSSAHADRLAVDFERLARRSPGLLAVFEPTGQIAWVNEAWTRRLGSQGPLVGSSLRSHTHPDDAERMLTALAGLEADGLAQPHAFRFRTTSGEHRWLEGSLQLEPDGFIVGAFHDATLARAEHAAVVRKKELLTIAEELAGIGHWRYDRLADRLHWSPGVFRIHGRAIERGMPSVTDAVNAYHVDDRPVVAAAVAAALDRAEPFTFELRLVRDDGATRIVRSVGRPELDPVTGDVIAIFGVFIDVTEPTELAESLRAAKLAAEEASRTKSRFLANMSHEIRTPLNGIVGTAEVMRVEATDPHLREMVETICMASQSLQTVIDDVLDVSKVEAGKLTLQPTPMVPNNLVRQVWSLFAATAREKRVDLLIDTRADAVILADPNRLRQVLSNLVSNALKFTDRGFVRVEARLETDRVHFAVRDTGLGIGSEALARIFDPFGQADDSISRRFGGTGLGLTISRQLVELMGGQLRVESQLGVGSVFSFEIPLRKAQAAPNGLRTSLASHRSLDRRLRILVAEDNLINQRVVSAMLGQLGCEVSVVSDGLQAVEAVVAGTWDLVLIDCQMPGLDGLAATRRIRASGQGALPIIALTASALEEDRAACISAGMDDFLPKPLRRAALEETLLRWSSAQAA